MLTKIRTAIGATFLAGVAVIAQTTSAAAADYSIGSGTDKCDSGQLCLWANGNFKDPGLGSKAGTISTSGSLSDFGKIFHDAKGYWGMNDIASSVYNHTGSRWCLYVDKDYAGAYLWIDPGWKGDLYSPFQDSISSARPCNG